MSQRIYLIILKIGIFLAFLSVFLVFKNLLFPYISSKQIYFNILIEILFLFWLSFVLKFPEYRPKKSLISIGLIGFFTAILLSCFFSVDFNLSFWGDVERMLGFFHIIHFLIFYFIIITVMRKWEDWRNLFICSVLTGVIMAFYSIFKTPHYATLGNTTYVSGYLIFNIYFALILFFREKIWSIKSIYILAILPMLAAFKFTYTRGAYVGLGISIIILLFLFAILNKNKKIKIYSLSAMAGIIIFISLVFVYSDSSVVKNNSTLNRITQISSQTETFQTRLIAWKAGIKDLKNHLITGTGFGNFAISFDKYFDPNFYNYTRSETYFDRAHNNLIDIVSTTGILGLLTYLFIFSATLYYLFKNYKKITTSEFILLICLIIAYFIQNLAVFDSLATYIGLMITLGYIYWLDIHYSFKNFTVNIVNINKPNQWITTTAVIIILIIIYQFNIKPARMLIGTIGGQIAFANNQVENGIDYYKKALSHNTVLDRDSRATLINSIVSNPSIILNLEKQKAINILNYVIELAEKNIKYNPKDSLMQMQLAQILDLASRLNLENPDKFNYYSDKALIAINQSIQSSPRRIPIYFSKAQIYLIRNEYNKAIEILQYAKSLNEKYYDSFCQLAKVYLFIDNKKDGYKEMDKCIDAGGAHLFNSANFINGLINDYQKDDKNIERVIKLYIQLSVLEPENAKIWAVLAKLYAKIGEIDKAVNAARKAGELDASLQQAVDQFIGSMNNN